MYVSCMHVACMFLWPIWGSNAVSSLVPSVHNDTTLLKIEILKWQGQLDQRNSCECPFKISIFVSVRRLTPQTPNLMPWPRLNLYHCYNFKLFSTPLKVVYIKTAPTLKCINKAICSSACFKFQKLRMLDLCENSNLTVVFNFCTFNLPSVSLLSEYFIQAEGFITQGAQDILILSHGNTSLLPG